MTMQEKWKKIQKTLLCRITKEGHLNFGDRYTFYEFSSTTRNHKYNSLLRDYVAFYCIEKIIDSLNNENDFKELIDIVSKVKEIMKEQPWNRSCFIDSLFTKEGDIFEKYDDWEYEHSDNEDYIGLVAAKQAIFNMLNTLSDDQEDYVGYEMSNKQYEFDIDPELWDTAYFVSIYLSGGHPKDDNSDSNKRKEFWTFYLTEIIPQAIRDTDKNWKKDS